MAAIRAFRGAKIFEGARRASGRCACCGTVFPNLAYSKKKKINPEENLDDVELRRRDVGSDDDGI